MIKNWAVGRIGIRASTEWPHARARNLFSRHIRAKKNAHDSLERFLPLFRVRTVLFFTSLCVRAVGSTICSFFREKRFFKIHILLGNQQNKNPRYRKGSKRDERERESRVESRAEKERERKREHVPVDLRAVCLVRAILNVFFCGVFFSFLSNAWWFKNNLGCYSPKQKS